MPVWNGVEWHEFGDPKLPKSPQVNIIPAGESRCEMSLWINWRDLTNQAATTAFLGSAEVATPAGGGKYVKRTNPFVHPDFNVDTCFIAESIKAEYDLLTGVSDNQTARGDLAKVTLGMRSIPNGYRLLPDDAVTAFNTLDTFILPREYFCLRNMEVSENSTAKFQTVQGNAGLRWVSDN